MPHVNSRPCDALLLPLAYDNSATLPNDVIGTLSLLGSMTGVRAASKTFCFYAHLRPPLLSNAGVSFEIIDFNIHATQLRPPHHVVVIPKTSTTSTSQRRASSLPRHHAIYHATRQQAQQQLKQHKDVDADLQSQTLCRDSPRHSMLSMWFLRHGVHVLHHWRRWLLERAVYQELFPALCQGLVEEEVWKGEVEVVSKRRKSDDESCVTSLVLSLPIHGESVVCVCLLQRLSVHATAQRWRSLPFNPRVDCIVTLAVASYQTG
jgi:hypothetical protein